MAPRSSSLSMSCANGTTCADHTELVKKARKNSKIALPASSHDSPNQHDQHQEVATKKQTKQHGPSYPNANVVIEVSAATLLDKNRHCCEVCYKGFARKQNLILHRRAHNLPFSLKPMEQQEPVIRKVYLCPEPTCPHHNRFHALGDFGGLKKHYLRKHYGQKKFKCDTCPKVYAAATDLKAHLKVCGKKKYACHCGARFSRRYNFVVHQENCVEQEQEDAPQDSPMQHMGDISVKTTSNNDNNNFLVDSTTPYIPTFDIQDNSNQNMINSNSPTAPYQSQMSCFDQGNIMTDPSMGLSLGQIFPEFFSPSSTNKNQESFDIGIYADLLTDKIPLNNVNFENMTSMGDGGNTYEYSSSLDLTPAMHNINLNVMLDPVCGVGSSVINQDFGGSYGDSQRFDYDQGGMEMLNFGTAAKMVAPYEQHLNQLHGFWF